MSTRYGLGALPATLFQARLAIPSRGSVDQRSQGIGILRLLRQLSHLREVRRRRRCRGVRSDRQAEGSRGEDYDPSEQRSASASIRIGLLAIPPYGQLRC